ncbi:hypothetical protein, partial [Pseudomonas viridiflava]|uniref:hypothetical protein n=1 Tax=Pseudomonas viridiflava TaxID=33069 RepID=UPI00197D788E
LKVQGVGRFSGKPIPLALVQRFFVGCGDLGGRGFSGFYMAVAGCSPVVTLVVPFKGGVLITSVKHIAQRFFYWN